jgi:hypothetical protein
MHKNESTTTEVILTNEDVREAIASLIISVYPDLRFNTSDITIKGNNDSIEAQLTILLETKENGL